MYCGKPVSDRDGTVDHMLPLARGGSNNDDNLVAACKKCNELKNNRTPLEFFSWKYLLEGWYG